MVNKFFTIIRSSGKETKADKLLKKLRPPGTDVVKIMDIYKEMNRKAQEVNKFKAIANNKPVMKKLATVLSLFTISVLTGRVPQITRLKYLR